MTYQPKSYRKFLATSVAAAMVATVAAPMVLANFDDVVEGSYYSGAVDYLVEKEVLEGFPDGSFQPSAGVTRAQAAKILVETLGLEVPTTVELGFTDTKDDVWYSGHVAALVEAGIIEGYSNGTFAPSKTITRAELAKMVVEANKLVQDTNVEIPFTDTVTGAWYEDSVNTLYSLGIVNGMTGTSFAPGQTVSRAQAAVFVHRTEVEAVRLEVEKIVTDPMVESVSAINATTVEVKFSVAVNATDAAITTKYELNGVNPTGVTVSSDKMTATLTFASAEATSKVFSVDAIQTNADALVNTEVFTKVYSYTDTSKPEILSVTSKTADATASSITIKASEPIAAGSTLKIDGVSTGITFVGDTATVTGLSLDSTKTHTIEVLNLTDKAATPNVTTYTVKTFSITVDTVKPVATLSAQSDKTILVTFNKSMDPATVTTALAANTVVKSESLAPVNHGIATVVAGTDNKQFTISITDTLYTTSTSRTLYVVLPTGMTDSLGNALSTTTQSVVLTKDAVKPVATGFKVIKDVDGKVTDIEVSFSEGLAVKAQGAVANPTIVDENGVLVTSFLGGITSDAVVAGDKKVTYSVTTAAKVYDTYNFSFASAIVSDQAETPNTSAAFTYDYNFGAETPGSTTFSLVSATETNATSNIITVNYGTAVVGGNVANSATVLSSYTLNGKALPTGTTITLDSTKNVATITLPADSIATTDTAAIFTVSGVKSTTGSTLNSYTGTVQIADNTAAVLESAQLIGNTVYLTFGEALDTTAAADAAIAEVLANYEIKAGTTTVVVGTTGVATTSVVANSSDKKLAITFSTPGDSGFDATKTITVETLAGGDLVDANSVAAKAGIKVTAN